MASAAEPLALLYRVLAVAHALARFIASRECEQALMSGKCRLSMHGRIREREAKSTISLPVPDSRGKRKPRSARPAALRLVRGGQGATRLRAGVALESRVPARTRHDAETVARHLRVLTVTTRIGAVISVFFGIQGLIVGQDVLWIAVLNLASGAIFLMIPLLYRFGELVAAAGVLRRRLCIHHRRVLAPRHGLGSAVLLPRRGDPHGADPRRRPHRARVGTRRLGRRDGHRARDARSL